MTSRNPSWSISLGRKLTADETTSLQQKLRPLFKNGEEEDIRDIMDYAITIVANDKDINYMVDEINSMELEFCPPSLVDEMGALVLRFIQGSKNDNKQSEQSVTQEEIQTSNQNKRKIAILKSPDTNASKGTATGTESMNARSTSNNGGNALSMAGALSASRVGGRKQHLSTSTTPPKKKSATLNADRPNHHGNTGKKDDPNSSTNRQRDGRGGGGREDRNTRVGNRNSGDSSSNRTTSRRDQRGRAFDRLSGVDSHRGTQEVAKPSERQQNDRNRNGIGSGRGDAATVVGNRGGRHPREPGRGGRSGGDHMDRRGGGNDTNDDHHLDRGGRNHDQRPMDRAGRNHDQQPMDRSGRSSGRHFDRGGGRNANQMDRAGGRNLDHSDRGGDRNPNPLDRGGRNSNVISRDGLNRDRVSGRGGRMDGRSNPGRGGRGMVPPGGRGRGRDIELPVPPPGDGHSDHPVRDPDGIEESASKRMRVEEAYEAEQVVNAPDQPDPNFDPNYGYSHDGYNYYNDGYGQYYPTWQGRSPFRGGRRGRGSNVFVRGGRGRSEANESGITQGTSDVWNTEVDQAVLQVASTHPSPIVAQNFRYGFRTYGAPRGRTGGGRGFFSTGRAEQVKSMLASKTWVRKKDGEGEDRQQEESLDKPNADEMESS